MPELPDITLYIEALERRIQGRALERVRINSPFLLRSFDPPLTAVEGKRVVELRRLGKRIAIGLDGESWLVLHLMIAGRLHWKPQELPRSREGRPKPPSPRWGEGSGVRGKLTGKYNLAAFDFSSGTLSLTEAGSKRRAALFVVRGEQQLGAHDPGGIDVMTAPRAAFEAVLRSRNHTLKRALTDPTLFSGIGNAYSDEILHRARLSPLALTQKLPKAAVARLHAAIRGVLNEWIERLRRQTGEGFPEKVTAFRPEMAVHGRFGKPCPVCSATVQRIRYAENETNYCPACQTEGVLLKDRSLSRLLKDDWPRSLDEL